jgi:UDP-N-acetylmuramate: L-alanyl-gamma-D-glutamyl-meso-diaminopimelate ligase
VKYHLIGIGGTGMGALAGLLKAAGHEVRGSDHAVYPPMSDQLRALGIPVYEGFTPDNLAWRPDLVVVGNVCSKDHPEVIGAQQHSLPLTSFPAVLGERFLTDRNSIVISGTHGKTTTSSLVTHILVEAGRDPSCLVGGVPLDLGRGWRFGKGDDFVVEGDEYDSAFFDKGSKFLHYRPKTAILTSVELDHVDIFSSMDAIRQTFRKFVALIPEDGLLVVAADNAEAMEVSKAARCKVESYAVRWNDAHTRAETAEVADDADEMRTLADVAPATWEGDAVEYLKSGRTRFDLRRNGESLGTFETILTGAYNLANVIAAIAATTHAGVQIDVIRRAVGSFFGVTRRQQFRGIANGVTLIDDYAHHPTAVAQTLLGLRRRFRGRRLIALYEPRSATSRRATFQRQFAQAFHHADAVVVGALHDVSKIAERDRFDPEKLARDLHQAGTKASYLPEVDDIVKHVVELARSGDVCVVLSSGTFGGIHDKLIAALGDAVIPARPGDVPAIRELLASQGLEHDDLTAESYRNFYVCLNETGFVGCVAIEIYGEDAILRSLATAPQSRGQGYGWMLADVAIQQTRRRGVRHLYLIAAKQASDFFAEKHGFRVVDPSTVAPAIAQSSTFAMSPSRLKTQVAMRLDL